MKRNHLIVLAAMAAISHAAMAAGTHRTVYPLKPFLDAQPADAQVAFYFGDAEHPAIAASHGDGSAGIRVARKLDDETTSCNKALKEALASLRADAVNHGANAVVNIETGFHGTHTLSTTEFTCATSYSAAAIRVRGQLVTLEKK